MSSPCHIELTLSEKEEPVKKEVTDLFPFNCMHFLLILYMSNISYSFFQPDTQLASRKNKGGQVLRSGASS